MRKIQKTALTDTHILASSQGNASNRTDPQCPAQEPTRPHTASRGLSTQCISSVATLHRVQAPADMQTAFYTARTLEESDELIPGTPPHRCVPAAVTNSPFVFRIECWLCSHARPIPSLALKMYLAVPKLTKSVGSVSQVAEDRTDTCQTDIAPDFEGESDDVEMRRRKGTGRRNAMAGAKWKA